MRYAKGRRAWGECQRSGRRMLRKDMVKDEYVKGLLVDPAWKELEHPQDKPLRIEDPIALRRPATRRDKASDVYGPDERVNDNTLERRPALAVVLSIGPFSIEIV